MDEQLNSIIDKLADRLGVAVENLQPIAETVVRETANRGMVLTLLGFSAIAVSWLAVFVFARWLQAKGVDEEDHRSLVVGAFFAAGCVTAVGFACVADYLGEWVAPTRSAIEAMLL